jgi:hypothetical protein
LNNSHKTSSTVKKLENERENNRQGRLFQNFSFGTVTYPKEKIAFVYMFTSYRVGNFLQELVSSQTKFAHQPGFGTSSGLSKLKGSNTHMIAKKAEETQGAEDKAQLCLRPLYIVPRK